MRTNAKILGLILLSGGLAACSSSQSADQPRPCTLSADCLNGDVCSDGVCDANGKLPSESRTKISDVLFTAQNGESGPGLTATVAVRVNYLSDGPVVTLSSAPMGMHDSPVSHVIVVRRGSVQTYQVEGYVIEGQTTSLGTFASVWQPVSDTDQGKVILKNISTNSEPEISVSVSELNCVDASNLTIGLSGILDDQATTAFLALSYFGKNLGARFCSGMFTKNQEKWSQRQVDWGKKLDEDFILVQSIQGKDSRFPVVSTAESVDSFSVTAPGDTPWPLSKQLAFLFPCISSSQGYVCAALSNATPTPHWQVVEPQSDSVVDYGPIAPVIMPTKDINPGFSAIVPIPTYRGLLLPVLVKRNDTCSYSYSYSYSFHSPEKSEPLFAHTACPAGIPAYDIGYASTIVSFTGKDVTLVGLHYDDQQNATLYMIEDAVP